MYQLKTTEKESIGRGWAFFKKFLTITWVGSIAVAIWAPITALIIMGVSGLGLAILTGRVYTIQSLHRIRVILNLRERLLTLMDNEFVLRSVRDDQIWRGEPVSPEIEKKLAEFNELRTRLHDSLTKVMSDLFADLKPETKQEPN